MINSKCTDCKYAGDLDEICPKYVIGMADDGSPIIRSGFPLLCKDCPDRDIDFCKRYKDLICYNQQDPFNCKVNLTKDQLFSAELIKKHQEALEKALLKRGLSSC